MNRKAIYLAVALFCALSVSSCSILWSTQTVTYVGHSYEEAAAMLRSGNVASITIHIPKGETTPVSLSIDLRDGGKWTLSEKDQAQFIADVQDYNGSVERSRQVVVNKVTAYGVSRSTYSNASPTSAPR